MPVTVLGSNTVHIAAAAHKRVPRRVENAKRRKFEILLTQAVLQFGEKAPKQHVKYQEHPVPFASAALLKFTCHFHKVDKSWRLSRCTRQTQSLSLTTMS